VNLCSVNQIVGSVKGYLKDFRDFWRGFDGLKGKRQTNLSRRAPDG
jgi:hypothetical protein